MSAFWTGFADVMRGTWGIVTDPRAHELAGRALGGLVVIGFFFAVFVLAVATLSGAFRKDE